MTIAELLRDLKRAKPEVSVCFDFCRCVPTTVASWRGDYSLPAIGWRATGYGIRSPSCEDHPTVASLIAELEKATDGREYTGWKGGEYSYTPEDQLWVDNPGDYTKTELVLVEISDWQVILHTRAKL